MRRLVILIFLLLLVAGCGGRKATAPAPSTTGERVTHPEVGFTSSGSLRRHYAKHGREFGRISLDEYLRRAQALRDAPLGGGVEEIVRPDHVISRFDNGSGAFIAFDRDLAIRTFFRPDDGRDYFIRQAGLSH